MRARRLLGGRRKLLHPNLLAPPVVAVKAGRQHNGYDRAPQMSRALPIPTTFSPRHPSTFRWEHGLYKYATGIMTPSRCIQRSLDVDGAALKVYSTSPLSSMACSMLRSHLTLEDHPPPVSLGDTLRRLYHITRKAHAMFDSITGVYFQAYRQSRALRPLRLPWTIVTPRSRQWNLSCETYGSGTRSNASVPRITLAVASFDDSGAIERGPWSKSKNRIGVQISADLKPSILRYDIEEQSINVDGYKSSQGLTQAIVDDILFAMAEVTARRAFTTPLDLMTKLKNAILSYLKTSVLRPLIYFRDLEIIIMDANRQRYVSNILLSSDGNERYAHEESSVTSLPAPEADDGRHTPVTIEGGSRVNHIILSELTAQKIGFKSNSGEVETQPGLSAESLPISGAELVRAFDQICRGQEEMGLRSCIEASRSLALQYNTVQGRLTFTKPSSSSTASDKMCMISLLISDAGKSEPLMVVLPNYTMDVCFDHARQGRIHILGSRLFYGLSEDLHQDVEGSNKIQNTAAAEIYILSQAFESICRKFLDKVTFQTYEEIPSRLAVAMLELLEVPSLGIKLQTVKLSIRPVDEPEGIFRGGASRETKQSATLVDTDATLSPLKYTVSNDSRKQNELESSTRNVTEESAPLTPKNNVQAQKYTDSINKLGSTSTSYFETEGVRVRIRDDVILINNTCWTRSNVLEQKTGFEEYTYYLALPKSTNLRFDTISERINALIQEGLDGSARTGISQLRAVLSKLASLGSPPSEIRLNTRLTKLPTSSNISTSGSRTALKVDIMKTIPEKDDSASARPDNLRIKLPAFKAPVRLDSRDLTSDTEAHLSFTLEGVCPQEANHTITATEQMAQLLDVVHYISTNTLSSQSFTSLAELASRLVDDLLNRRNELGSTIDVRKITLATSLRDGGNTNRAIEKALSSKELELDVAVEGESEFQVSGDTCPESVQQDELEARAQSETDTKPSSAELGMPNGDSTGNPKENLPLQETKIQTAFIALGSNLGDRLGNIENACREMDTDPDIRIVRTSPLYETDPMYVSDQDRFLNGACQIETTLEPTVLLDRLQAIETRLGRVKIIDKGPRSIDLDILLYGNLSMTTDRLTIPHPLMAEREFVLRPLSDISDSLRIRGDGLPVMTALQRLPKSTNPMHPVVPLGPAGQYLRGTDYMQPTRLMSILNTTPDSFSDGGDNEVADIAKLQQTVRSQIAAGATIIDIGGQSSRPNAPDVTAEEEISRILPAIEAIKSLPEAANIAISVDTYRATVAVAAVTAGAHIINDISAGKLDPDMLDVIAKLGCTYVMMHMRGTPATMMSEENCTYDGDLIDRIADELAERVDRAQEAGIRRWRIVLDPGIGFSKTPQQNLEILGRLGRFRRTLRAYPWLVGTSRKSFIGKITGVQDPKKRVGGTSVTVTEAVRVGADIVRVHDVEEMASVVKMAEALYRWKR